MSQLEMTGRVEVGIDAIDTYYYAAAHRSVLRRIDVRNVDLPEVGEDLVIRVFVESAAGLQPLHEVTTSIPGTVPGTETVLNGLRLLPNHRGLALLDEQLEAHIAVTVSRNGKVVGQARAPITFLAFNQWMFQPQYFDSIAAFVQPNCAAVRGVLTRARDLLRERTGSDSTEGYQGSPQRVEAIACALYDAIRELGLRYSNPPAAFEGYGQKVRTPELVMEEQAATCLDSSVFYASCLVAAGLHAHIVMVEEHAFTAYETGAGHGIDPETVAQLLSRAVVENVNEVMLLVRAGVLQPVETTTLTADRDTVDFDGARRQNAGRFDDGGHTLEGLVNVAYARAHGVPSIPSQELLLAAPGGAPVLQEALLPIDDPAGEPVVAAPHDADAARFVAKDAAPPRVRAWLRSLLDLSFANPLLRLGGSKGSNGAHHLDLPSGMLGPLEDRIMSSGSFDLRLASDAPAALMRDPTDGAALAAELKGRGHLFLPSLLEHERSTRAYIAQVAAENPGVSRADVQRFVAHALAGMYAKELDKSFGGLRRRAREVETQTGANTLFLTIGTLSWIETNPTSGRKEDQARAPLFLVPVRITGKASTGFRVTVGEAGDVSPNYCLLEKLRQTYGIVIDDLERPVADDAGIDVDRMIGQVRAALGRANIRDALVTEDAYLAVLNFATFRLWKDLRDHWPTFLDSPVAKHLTETPNETFDDGERIQPLDPMTLRIPGELDASQQTAVEWAIQGRSFVLEGPPGTGKSQTIANLLAANIAAGRKVLFVAEKQAALQVVKKRVAELGLGTFCLDLHDKGSKPEQIRAQIKASLDFAPIDRTSALTEATAAWLADGTALHGYRQAMHAEGPSGHSAWSARQARMEMGDGNTVDVPRSFVNVATQHLPKVQQTLLDLPRIAGAAPIERGAPWAFAGLVGFDTLDTATLAATLDNLEGARKLLEASTPFLLSLEHPSDWQAVLDLVEVWREGRLLPDATIAAVASPAWAADRDRALDRLERVVADQAPVLQVLSPSVYSLDLDLGPLLVAGQEAVEAGLLSRGKKERAFRGLASPYVHSEAGTVDELLAHLRQAAAARADLAAARRAVTDLPGAALLGDWSALDPQARANVRAQLSALPIQARGMAKPTSASARVALGGGWVPDDSVVGAIQYAVRAWTWLLAVIKADSQSLQRWQATASFFEAWTRSAPRWQADAPRFLALQRWCELAASVEPLRPPGLDHIADAILSGNLAPPEVFERFRRGFVDVALAERLESGRIDLFDGRAQDRRIEDFAKHDRRRRVLMRDQIPADLVALRPMHHGRRIGRWGAIEQELQRKSRRLSIRNLVTQYNDILPSLTPCFLMSPDSVSRFIPPGSITFDLVVFDEASQIEVAKAIGAIGRGKAVVVVGDTRQMPPSRFGGAGGVDAEADADPEDENVYVDEESILSECTESNMPRLWLSNHYRSKHEALIAFSNHNFYDGRLTTFPSPLAAATSPIGWRRVNGTFERSGSGDTLRTNQAEAEAIVGEILTRINDPERAKQSIAVVTLNIQQQSLIHQLLETSGDTRAKALLEDEGEDGLIIRNLESVQGDERDVVLISIAFSPLITVDASGVENRRLPLNFGPLNRAGGERRLNVAVTRARREVVVFCSFDPEDMKLTESSSVGVQLLRTYLQNARDGATRSGDLVTRAPSPPDPHRSEIAEALRARGYRVRENIGLSDFRIDLAVGEEGSDGWLVAVLLDGPGWAAKRTVYDREVLPKSVLCGAMGWLRLERVWFPMWLNARQEVLRNIEDAVAQAAAEGAHPKPGAAPVPTPVEDPVDLEVEPAREPESARPVSTGLAAAAAEAESSLQPEEPVARPATVALPMAPAAASPVLGDLDQQGTRDVLDRLNDLAARQQVLRTIEMILSRDAPIHADVLARWVANLFGLVRVRASRLDAILEVVPPQLVRDTVFGVFVWNYGQNPEAFTSYRPVYSDGQLRPVELVAPEELANAMVAIVTSAGGAIDEAELISITNQEFGAARVNASAREHLAAVISWAVENGRLADLDGRLVLPLAGQ